MRRHISGREATNMTIESDKRGPVKIEPLTARGASAPSPTSGSAALESATEVGAEECPRRGEKE